MTGDNLKAWRERMGYSKTRAAEELGTSRNSLAAWEEGVYPVPRFIELACNWLTVSSTLPGTLRCILSEIEGTME